MRILNLCRVVARNVLRPIGIERRVWFSGGKTELHAGFPLFVELIPRTEIGNHLLIKRPPPFNTIKRRKACFAQRYAEDSIQRNFRELLLQKNFYTTGITEAFADKIIKSE